MWKGSFVGSREPCQILLIFLSHCGSFCTITHYSRGPSSLRKCLDIGYEAILQGWAPEDNQILFNQFQTNLDNGDYGNCSPTISVYLSSPIPALVYSRGQESLRHHHCFVCRGLNPKVSFVSKQLVWKHAFPCFCPVLFCSTA